MRRLPWIWGCVVGIVVLVGHGNVRSLYAQETQPEEKKSEPFGEKSGEKGERPVQEQEGPDAPEAEPLPPPLPSLPVLPMPSRREPVVGDDLILQMKTGERYEGAFVSSDDFAIRLRIAGLEIAIDKASVDRMTVLDPPLIRYRKMRELIRDDNAPQLAVLADWLIQRRYYDEALTELGQALKAEPENGEALRLKRLAFELKSLSERSRPLEPAEGEPETSTVRPFPQRPKASDLPLLTTDQINLIKVFEVDLRDPPRLVVPREVIEKLLVEFSDDPLIPETREGREAFFRLPPERILDVMFRLRARELYASIQVVDQPRSMQLFRDNVHSAWLVNNCATTRCHGGSEAGRLQLINYRPNSDASVYTNFLIIERFRLTDDKPLIDYEEPERSPLLQLGLPQDDSRFPHPRIRGWTPAFRNREHRRFEQAAEWIRSMYRPRPDYPIEYTPPSAQSAQDPGATPAPGMPEEPIER